MREVEITRAIVERYTEKFFDAIESQVAVAGAGPAGLCAAYYLATSGIQAVVFEKRLATGGGVWGGGAGCNVVVVEDPEILNELGVRSESFGDLYTADAVELAAALAYKAEQAGARIFNLCEVEDIVVKQGVVKGVVLNSTAILMAGLHVDPVCAACEILLDATGHPAEVAKLLKRKIKDFHPEEIGEGFMDVEASEKAVVAHTGEVYPGLFLAGMSVSAFYNQPRMGPIFGGMLESGRKAAQLIQQRLSEK